MLSGRPESPRLQAALRDLMRVVSAANAVQPDIERSLFFYQEPSDPDVSS
jgi:hypothetical protein